MTDVRADHGDDDLGPDEIDQIVTEIRRDHVDRLPPAPRNESDDERQVREERTRYIIEREILPAVGDLRRSRRQLPLSATDENEVIERIVGDLFTLPKLNRAIRQRGVNDLLVIGNEMVRLDHHDGSITYESPIARRDRDLERIIYDVASRYGRPFNHEAPFVDLELEPGVRFHAGGFDVNQRPYIRIRVASMFGADFDTLYDRGACDQGIVALLRAAIAAGMRVLFVGRMASGKTTWLRASVAAIDPDRVITTIESSFELNVKQMGKHRWVMAYQERLPSTVDSTGMNSSELMTPSMRTGSDWLIVGEVRGTEAAALLRAMQTGQGAMGTVHGGSAAEGVETLVDLATGASGQRRNDVKTQAYRATDLVVHLAGRDGEGRWVSEIIAPSVEDDGERYIQHRIYAESDHAADQRARPAQRPPTSMMRRLMRADPTFDGRWWANHDDTYKPLQIGGTD